MKSLEKISKGSPSAINLTKGEQYGLGIHIFKIESLKSVPLTQPKNQKNPIKNNQNPFVSKPPLPKRMVNLPTIQKEKTSTDVIKSKNTIRKNINNTIKPSLSLTKPNSQSYQTNSHSLKKINNHQNTPKHIFKNYNSQLNQVINFYTQYQTEFNIREKQLKKINIGHQRELPQLFSRKVSSCVIDDIVNHQELNQFDMRKQYEQYSILNYTISQGFKIFNYENERNKQII